MLFRVYLRLEGTVLPSGNLDPSSLRKACVGTVIWEADVTTFQRFSAN